MNCLWGKTALDLFCDIDCADEIQFLTNCNFFNTDIYKSYIIWYNSTAIHVNIHILIHSRENT